MNFKIPVINLDGIYRNAEARREIVEKIGAESENWGFFFQIINHRIPQNVMDEMIDGVRRFHEQDVQIKRKFYSRDHTKSFRYNSNFFPETKISLQLERYH